MRRGNTRYFVVETASGKPRGVLRYYYERGVEVSFHVWRNGGWVEDDRYASIVLLGDPPSTEVDEQEAMRVIEQLFGRQ